MIVSTTLEETKKLITLGYSLKGVVYPCCCRDNCKDTPFKWFLYEKE